MHSIKCCANEPLSAAHPTILLQVHTDFRAVDTLPVLSGVQYLEPVHGTNGIQQLNACIRGCFKCLKLLAYAVNFSRLRIQALSTHHAQFSSFTIKGIKQHQEMSTFQGWTLLLVGPFVDLAITQNWILNYEINVPALFFLCLSCTVAVLVNVSQFMCLGRFSAVTFQVSLAFFITLYRVPCSSFEWPVSFVSSMSLSVRIHLHSCMRCNTSFCLCVCVPSGIVPTWLWQPAGDRTRKDSTSASRKRHLLARAH